MLGLSSEVLAIILAIIGFLLTIIVALLLFIIQMRSARPKLVTVGSGVERIHVPNQDVMASSVSFENRPTFLGMRVDRGPVKIQSAMLYDLELKEFVGPSLMWREEGSSKLEGQCTIEPGTNRTLYVFAKERFSEEYFVYTASSLDVDYNKTILKFKDRKKNFAIHLTDTIGNRYRFDVVARNGDESVGVRFTLTWDGRIRMIMGALRLLKRAFTPG